MVDIDRRTAINSMPLRLLWALCELINAKYVAAHYVYLNRPCYNIP